MCNLDLFSYLFPHNTRSLTKKRLLPFIFSSLNICPFMFFYFLFLLLFKQTSRFASIPRSPINNFHLLTRFYGKHRSESTFIFSFLAIFFFQFTRPKRHQAQGALRILLIFVWLSSSVMFTIAWNYILLHSLEE